MGAWGFKALESDEGLDVIDFLEEHIPKNYVLKLSNIISQMKGDLLGNDFHDIDFLYDNSAIAIAELYCIFKDKGRLNYTNEDDNTKSLTQIQSFTATKSSLKYLLRLLQDIKQEVPDKDGEREIVSLWKKSAHWKKWEKNLGTLIKRIQEEITNKEML